METAINKRPCNQLHKVRGRQETIGNHLISSATLIKSNYYEFFDSPFGVCQCRNYGIFRKATAFCRDGAGKGQIEFI